MTSNVTPAKYLARIIFEEMMRKHNYEETGFGIGSQLHDDVYKLVTVDCDNQSVKVEHVNYSPKVEWKGSFEDFISHKFKDDEDDD